jgi:hypothetical protein
MASNSVSFGTAKDRQGAGSMRGVIHTWWQRSMDLLFDMTPHETGINDTSSASRPEN